MFYLCNGYKIDKFQDGEALLQQHREQKVIVLNKTAYMILDLILKYELDEAKKRFVSKFLIKDINEGKVISKDFDVIVNDFVQKNIIYSR